MMVMFGLGLRQTFTRMMEYTESPPLTVVSPCSDDEKQDCLNCKTDTVREENDRVDYGTVSGELLGFVT